MNIFYMFLIPGFLKKYKFSEFNTMLGLFTCEFVYDCTFLLKPKLGTGTISIWYNTSCSCIYVCMEIGNWTFKFLSSLIPNVTNFIS